MASGTNNLVGIGGSGGLINGMGGNQVGVAHPGLGTLGNYGGPTATISLLPGSPALGTGTADGLNTDQRGRPLDSPADIGAFQSQGFTLTPTAGTPQSAGAGSGFTPLEVLVAAKNGVEPVAGGGVTVTANPAAGGASASLTPTTATIGTNGVAQVGATANSIVGSYTVTAATAGASVPATFSLTNETPGTFLVANPSIPFGTASVTLSGTLSFGTQFPPQGEHVLITLGGTQQQTTIGAGGAFSAVFSTTSLKAAGSSHAFTYSYSGNGANIPASGSGTITVTPLTPTVTVADLGGRSAGAPSPRRPRSPRRAGRLGRASRTSAPSRRITPGRIPPTGSSTA